MAEPDPYRQHWSPYVGMGNNPVNGIDPDGGYLFGLFGSRAADRQAARQLADIKGGEVLNIHTKDIAVTWQEHSIISEGKNRGMTFTEIVVTQDFKLENNLSLTEAVIFNAYQGDLNSVAILRDAGYKNLSFNLHLKGLRDRSGSAFLQFGIAAATAPLSMGVGSFSVNVGRFGLGEAMWSSRLFGSRSLAFGRYHSQFVTFGTRGFLNTAQGGKGIGIGWSNHGTRHVFRMKINGTKFLNIYK